MCTGQCESGGRVVERSTRPIRCRVTSQASRGKTSGGMGRIGRAGVVWFVATIAIGRRRGVIAIQVAGGASHADMCTCQWENCLAVIECSRLPGSRIVANSAGCRDSRGSMRWIGSSVVILRVTGITIRRG